MLSAPHSVPHRRTARRPWPAAIPARPASAGNSTPRAVSPGARNSPVSAINAHNIQNCRMPANCNGGIAAISTPQAISEATLTRRRPIRSMTGPVTRAASTVGSSVQNATIPALAALPVLCSTNHARPCT